MSFIDSLVNQFGDEAIDYLSGRLGAEQGQTSSAIKSLIPILVSAMNKNTNDRTGADAFHDALSRDHDGSIFDDLMGYITTVNDTPVSMRQSRDNGAGIIKHVLGGQTGTIADLVSKVSGMNPNAVGFLMETLAPIIMGSLGKQQRQQQMNQRDLSDFLQQSQDQMIEKAPSGMGGLIGQLLDRDGDGSINDDLAGMAFKYLGSMLTGR